MTLRIIIPAWNEAGQISKLFHHILSIGPLLALDWKVVLIDDGSCDLTAEEAGRFSDSMQLQILRHTENRGVSEAFRTGFRAVMQESVPGDVVLTMEANENTDLSIVPRMLALHSRGCDLILASCYAPGGAVIGDPFLRLFLSKGINRCLKVLFPADNIHTYTSFYRLWSHELISEIAKRTGGRFFHQENFVCMADMLLEARKIPKIRIEEIAYILKSDIQEKGSKMRIGRTVMGYVRLIASQLFG